MTTQDTTQTKHTTTFEIAPAVAERLVRTAEALEREWAALDAGFVSDRLREAVNVLRTHGRRRKDGSRRTAAEQVEFAEALLRHYCHQTGKRDAVRKRNRPQFVSLEALSEQGWDAPGAHPQADWLRAEIETEDAATLPCDLARHLEDRGGSRERAWMFVWAAYQGLEWQQVARLLETRFETRSSLPALRKWASNNFPRLRTDAAAFYAARYGNPPRHIQRLSRHDSGGKEVRPMDY